MSDFILNSNFCILVLLGDRKATLGDGDLTLLSYSSTYFFLALVCANLRILSSKDSITLEEEGLVGIFLVLDLILSLTSCIAYLEVLISFSNSS